MTSELVRFRSHPNPFTVATTQCQDPECDCGEVSFSFLEQCDTDSVTEPIEFSLVVDPEAWRETNPPARPANIAAFAEEFLRDFPQEERATFLKTLHKKREISRRIREYRLSPEQTSGQLVSFREIIETPEALSDPNTYTYRFRHNEMVYLVEDLYCANPNCPCRDVLLRFCLYKPPATPEGEARIEQIILARLSIDGALQLHERFHCTREKAEDILAAWESRFYTDILLLKRRYKKIREIAGRSVRPHTVIRGDASSTSPLFPPPERKIGRNDPCPCGSGMKYKRCCGR